MHWMRRQGLDGELQRMRAVLMRAQIPAYCWYLLALAQLIC